MKKMMSALPLLISLMFLPSCASIVSDLKWPLAVESIPEGARVRIVNEKGRQVFAGKTPAELELRAGAGFFTKHSYTVEIAMEGFETKVIDVDTRINGWYFGNILFGGLIGMLIVDPATGAMWKLDEEIVSVDLVKTGATVQDRQLRIISIDQVPAEMRKHLVSLK